MGDDAYVIYLGELTAEFLTKHFGVENLQRFEEFPLTGPGGLRRQLGELDLEYFSRAYFPEYFMHPVPQFHKDAYTELTTLLASKPATARKVRAWPRGNAKSTIYNFFTPMNSVVYGKRNFVVIVSDTESQAHSFLGDIKDAIEANQKIITDFGDMRGPTWRAGEIIVVSASGDRCKLVGVGAESGVRGIRQAQHRPDLIIVDDLEDDEAVQTIERVNKRWSWFQRALMSLGNEFTDIVVVGTVLAFECCLDRLLSSPAWDSMKLEAVKSWSTSPLWEDWQKIYTDMGITKDARVINSRKFFEENKAEMLEGTSVLWPEGKPYITLMEIHTDIGELAFFAEHQNNPINPQDCPFNPEDFTFYDEEEMRNVRITATYGALDPSLGRTRLSDYAALITLGRGNNGYIYVLDAVIERLTPDKLIDLAISKMKQFNYMRFAIEVNQFQDLLRIELIRASGLQNVRIPIVQVRHNKDKVIRVQTLLPHVKNGYIKFNREHTLLLHQLHTFPRGRHDDGPDCLEMCYRQIAQGPTFDPLLAGHMERRSVWDDDEDEDYMQGGFYDLA